MWLCLSKGFISAIRYNEEILVIRSRERETLKEYFPESEIFESKFSDYQFRIFCNREKFATWLFYQSLEIKNNLLENTKEKNLLQFFSKIKQESKMLLNVVKVDIYNSVNKFNKKYRNY